MWATCFTLILLFATRSKECCGLACWCPGPAVTVPGGHGDGTFAVTGATPEELCARTEEVCAHRPDLIKTCVTGGVIDAKKEGEPGELKMSEVQTAAVCKTAHAYGCKVASHTESSEGIRVALKAGVDSIEHGAPLDEELVTLFKEKQAALIWHHLAGAAIV